MRSGAWPSWFPRPVDLDRRDGPADGPRGDGRFAGQFVELADDRLALAADGPVFGERGRARSASGRHRLVPDRVSDGRGPFAVLPAAGVRGDRANEPIGRAFAGGWASIAPRVADPALRGEFVIVTGPSRTADIEKILILGVHGPKRLVVLLVDG